MDGHKCADVMEYRKEVFLPFWMSIEGLMMKWNNENKPIEPTGILAFPQQKRIVLVTHDESTFYANDCRKSRWIDESERPEPVHKGEGTSLMVSDFCSPDLGWLKSKDGLVLVAFLKNEKLTREFRSQEAWVVFKAGKNRDGYFDCADLCAQTEKAIELFEDNFPGTAMAAFGFDNAPGHQKQADDALSACHMPKFPKKWHRKHSWCKMRHGTLPNGCAQDFYFPDTHKHMPGWFKGMKLILEERGFL